MLQELANGVVIGSILTIVALGVTLKFSVLDVPDFAHGSIYMFGAFVAYYLVTLYGFDFILAALTSMALMAVLGIAIEKGAFRPLRNAPPETMFVSAVALLIIMEHFALIVWGEPPRVIPTPSYLKGVVRLDGLLAQSYTRIALVGTVVLAIVLLHLFIKKSKVGKTMRAVAQKRDVARLMGISVDRTASFTFAIGSATAGLAGALIGTAFFLDFLMGNIILKAFVIVVLGGMGSVVGAIVGGYALGMTESFVTTHLGSVYANTVFFLILIAVLALRPEGVFGKRGR